MRSSTIRNATLAMMTVAVLGLGACASTKETGTESAPPVPASEPAPPPPPSTEPAPMPTTTPPATPAPTTPPASTTP